MDKAEKPGRGWFLKATLAELFGVTPQHFDRHYRRFAGPDATRTHGGKLYFHGRTLVDAWAESMRVAAVAPSVDPLLAGGDSPALERYRTARALLAEMEVDRQRENLIPREEIEVALTRFAGVLRRAGESLAREFGNEAAGLMNEAVDEVAKEWSENFCAAVADA